MRNFTGALTKKTRLVILCSCHRWQCSWVYFNLRGKEGDVGKPFPLEARTTGIHDVMM